MVKADWTLSFDYEGWNKVPQFSIINSMWARQLTGLHYIDYALSKKVVGSDDWDCEAIDWAEGATGWSDCPVGTFLSGFYRTGSRWDWKLGSAYGTKQIDKVWCCKARESKSEWGKCTEMDAFHDVGYTTCPDIDDKPSALVGLFRTDEEKLKGIKQAKCCLMADDGLVEVEATPG